MKKISLVFEETGADSFNFYMEGGESIQYGVDLSKLRPMEAFAIIGCRLVAQMLSDEGVIESSVPMPGHPEYTKGAH